MMEQSLRERPMRHFSIQALCDQMGGEPQKRWIEFLRASSLSMGIYHLSAGEADKQKPHSEDEVYYVISGSASFRAGDQRERVQAGSVIFVEKQADHRFVDIETDLTLLVFFAPPEGSLTDQHHVPETRL